ncbi:unnamed protein product, partial [Heterosigma akashiwo]
TNHYRGSPHVPHQHHLELRVVPFRKFNRAAHFQSLFGSCQHPQPKNDDHHHNRQLHRLKSLLAIHDQDYASKKLCSLLCTYYGCCMIIKYYRRRKRYNLPKRDCERNFNSLPRYRPYQSPHQRLQRTFI